jgi:hypothetical protein
MVIKRYHILFAPKYLFTCDSPLLVEFVATPVQLFEVRLKLDLDLLDNTRSKNSTTTTRRSRSAPPIGGVSPTLT